MDLDKNPTVNLTKRHVEIPAILKLNVTINRNHSRFSSCRQQTSRFQTTLQHLTTGIDIFICSAHKNCFYLFFSEREESEGSPSVPKFGIRLNDIEHNVRVSVHIQ